MISYNTDYVTILPFFVHVHMLLIIDTRGAKSADFSGWPLDYPPDFFPLWAESNYTSEMLTFHISQGAPITFKMYINRNSRLFSERPGKYQTTRKFSTTRNSNISKTSIMFFLLISSYVSNKNYLLRCIFCLTVNKNSS